jgi:hypothetical protein
VQDVSITESSTPITGSLTGDGVLFTTETLGANTISIQLSGDWKALCTFQVSNDSTYWANVQGYTFNNYMSSTNTAQDNGVYIFPVTGRYFQVVVSNYRSGTVAVVAYLRQQSLAGIGETMLTQAMDSSNNTPMNVTFPGMTSTVGQQSTVTSFPVALATEQIQDKQIIGKLFSGATPVNTVLSGDASGSANLNGFIDCLQYRSVAIHVVQSTSATAGAVIFEVSNDGVNTINNPVGFFDTQGVDSTTLGATNTSSLSTTGAKLIVRVGNISYRYFRIRVSTAFTGTPTVQAFVTLRMTASPYLLVPQANMQAIANGSFPAQTGTGTNATNTPVVVTNQTTAYMPIGGDDKSIVNPVVQSNPGPIASTNVNYSPGPYYRRNYVDYTGSTGVAGPDPRYAEDKTYPVNVRLERSTAGQDSVQDLLQQILVELKAMNYYTRETPSAIAQMMQYPSATAEYPTSMADEPESFVYDKNSFN